MSDKEQELKLWCDLKNDKEKIEFLKNGRACDTGIIAPILVSEFIELLEIKIKYQ